MKPRIFISSTIYDFRDLRSALKFHLESFGYEILLSEYNDFTKKIDTNSFQACLDTIALCDYYILLIGSRTGGFFDLTNNISITQKEYQTAYEKVKNKKLKILIFIRDEIWIIREDRKALKETLLNELKDSREINDTDIEKVKNYKSKIVNDAKFIFGFIDEVTRSSEMNHAIKGKGEYPINNWVHKFKDFKDIIDVLNVEFNIKRSVFEESIFFNLKQELLDIIKNLLTKSNGKIQKQNLWGFFARKNISKELDGFSNMKYKYIKWLSAFIAIGMSTTTFMRTHFIELALERGIFLEYDTLESKINQSVLSDSLGKLLSKIIQGRKIEESTRELSTKFIAKYEHLKGTPDESIVRVDNFDIISFLVAFDRQEDILNLAIGLYKALDGNAELLRKVKLNPVNPFEEESKQMDYETPSDEEIINWINDYKTG